MSTDVQIPAVESSTTAREVPASPVQIDLASLTKEQRQHWRDTGELPEKTSPATEAAAASKETKSAADKAEKGAPASEAGTDTQTRPRRANAEDRKGQLNAEIRELLAKRDALRAEVDGKGTETKTEEKKAESSTAAPARTSQLEPPKKPDIKDYDTLEAFDAAKDKYSEEMIDYKVKKAREDERIAQAQAESQDRINRQFEDARKRYPNIDTVVQPAAKLMQEDPNIHQAVKDMIGESPVIVDLVYTLAEDEAEFKDFLNLARTQPGNAIRVLVSMENLIEEELGKASKSKEQPNTAAPKVETKPAEKTISRVPPPVTELSGRSTTDENPEMSAARAGDFRAFKQAAHARFLSRHKG